MGVSNLDSFAEFSLKHGLGGRQCFHCTPVFLPKLLFWSVPERYYFQFSLGENVFSNPLIQTDRITQQTECMSLKNHYTPLSSHTPTAKNKYEQITSRVQVSHLVQNSIVTCSVSTYYLNECNAVHINMLFMSSMPNKIKGRQISNALNHPQAQTSLLKQSWPKASITRVGWKPCYATLCFKPIQIKKDICTDV